MKTGAKWMSRRRITAVLIIISALIAVGAAMAFFESSMIFYPVRHPVEWMEPSVYGLKYEDAVYHIESGFDVHGWWFPKREQGAVIVFFHGNAGHIAHRLDFAGMMLNLDASVQGLLMMDYPGYGKSGGRPNEKVCYETGRGACQYLKEQKKVKSQEIVFFGRSLGAAVALETSLHVKGGALVMESAFLSTMKMASEIFPIIPGISRLIRQKFDNERKIDQIDVPLLIIHGNKDEIVPVEHGKKLFSLAPEPKTYYEIERAGHNDTYLVGGAEYWKAWKDFLQDFKGG